MGPSFYENYFLHVRACCTLSIYFYNAQLRITPFVVQNWSAFVCNPKIARVITFSRATQNAQLAWVQVSWCKKIDDFISRMCVFEKLKPTKWFIHQNFSILYFNRNNEQGSRRMS